MHTSSGPFLPPEYEAEVERLRPRLVLWAATRMGNALRNAMEPEDLADIALTEVHRDLSRFRGTTRREFQGWVFRIADTSLKDQADRVGAQKRQPRELPPRSQTSPSQAMTRQEDIARLRQALTRLKDEHREVIRLIRLEGHSTAEVAKVLDRSPNAVRILLCRALQALGEELVGTPP